MKGKDTNTNKDIFNSFVNGARLGPFEFWSFYGNVIICNKEYLLKGVNVLIFLESPWTTKAIELEVEIDLNLETSFISDRQHFI